MKSKIMASLAFILAGALSIPACADVIVGDKFNRGTPAAPKALGGTVPEKSSGGKIKWTAGAWVTDGSAAVIEGAEGQSAFMPFKPRSGKIYELSAVVMVAAPSDGSNDWIGLGFSQGGKTDLQIFANSQSRNGIMVRPAGTVHNYYEGKSTMLYAEVDGGIKIAVLLDTREAQWKLSWKINDRIFGKPHVLSSNPKIYYAGFGNLRKAAGTVKDFVLQEN